MAKAVIVDNQKYSLVSKDIDTQVSAVLSSSVQGFEKAFIMSTAIGTIRERLTPEFMQPIMALQGSRLGFLTDKDIDAATKQKGPGYPESVVKDCLIDAVLLGLEATGNQFNIIGGNMYPTREGFGALLDKMPNLKKNFTYTEVRQTQGAKSANVVVKIDWQFTGEEPKKQIIDFPIKNGAYTSQDALIGKAERKAKRWLYNTIKGTDISDGDVNDIPHVVVNDAEGDKYDHLKDLYAKSEHNLTESEKNDLKKVIDEKQIMAYDKAIDYLTKKIPVND